MLHRHQPWLPERVDPLAGGASDAGEGGAAAVSIISNASDERATDAPDVHRRQPIRNRLQWMGAAVLCFLAGISFDRHLLGNKPSTQRRILSTAKRLDDPGEWSTADEGGGESEAPAPRSSTGANAKPVEKIILLGERHSGTNWITDHLADCFGGAVPISNDYARFKHWFQEDDLQKVPENSAVVIAMFRDPYDWVEAMRVEPHHAHDHLHWHRPYNASTYWHRLASPMKWKGFVTRPWIGHRGRADKLLSNRTEEARCLDEYSWADAAPCSPEDARKVKGLGEYKYEYQHDGSERGFASIIDLRRAKILNHLSVAEFRGTRSFFPFRFEDLNTNGTAPLLRSVEGATGLTAKCNATMGKAHRHLVEKAVIKHRALPEDFVRWMDRFVDWEVEGRIGYVKRGE